MKCWQPNTWLLFHHNHIVYYLTSNPFWTSNTRRECSPPSIVFIGESYLLSIVLVGLPKCLTEFIFLDCVCVKTYEYRFLSVCSSLVVELCEDGGNMCPVDSTLSSFFSALVFILLLLACSIINMIIIKSYHSKQKLPNSLDFITSQVIRLKSLNMLFKETP